MFLAELWSYVKEYQCLQTRSTSLPYPHHLLSKANPSLYLRQDYLTDQYLILYVFRRGKNISILLTGTFYSHQNSNVVINLQVLNRYSKDYSFLKHSFRKRNILGHLCTKSDGCCGFNYYIKNSTGEFRYLC